MSIKIEDREQQRFEAWARSEGLIQESHGIRSVNSMTDLARKAWNAALASRPPATDAPVAAMTLVPGGLQALVDMTGQPAMYGDVEVNPEPSARDQMHAERVSWNTKQWYEHVGAWENDTGEVVFGSVMALCAMLAQFQAVTLYAVPQRAASQPNSERDAARYRELRDHGLFVVASSGIGWAIRRDEPPSTAAEMDAAMDRHMQGMAAQQRESGHVQHLAPSANTERAWYKEWLATLTDNVTVDQIEFGRRVWAERARRAAKGSGQ